MKVWTRAQQCENVMTTERGGPQPRFAVTGKGAWCIPSDGAEVADGFAGSR